jgi:hypothetical protein
VGYRWQNRTSASILCSSSRDPPKRGQESNTVWEDFGFEELLFPKTLNGLVVEKIEGALAIECESEVRQAIPMLSFCQSFLWRSHWTSQTPLSEKRVHNFPFNLKAYTSYVKEAQKHVGDPLRRVRF